MTGTSARRLGLIGIATLATAAVALSGGATGAETPTPITITFNTPATGQRTPTARVVVRPTRTPSPTPTVVANVEPVALEFAADDWQGGLYQGNAEFYARPWTAVYGAQSPYPLGTLVFDLEAPPVYDLLFVVEGLDDEFAAQNQIALEINEQRVYEGDSPFLNFGGDFNNPEWTRVTIRLPADLLTAGENQIAFLSLEPSAVTNQPPYFLLSVASLNEVAPEDDVTPTPTPRFQPREGTDITIDLTGAGDDEDDED